MKFIILEVQTYNNGNVGTLVNAYDDRNEAEHRYHEVLSAAAISDLPMHTAFFLLTKAYVLKVKNIFMNNLNPNQK